MEIFPKWKIFLDTKKCGRWDLNKNYCILDNAYFKAFPAPSTTPHNTVSHTFCPFCAPLFIPIIFSFAPSFAPPMIQYSPRQVNLGGVLIDMLHKSAIIKLSGTVDALYLVFQQLRKARVEIIVF